MYPWGSYGGIEGAGSSEWIIQSMVPLYMVVMNMWGTAGIPGCVGSRICRAFETEFLIPTFIGWLLYEKKLFWNL